MRGRLFGFSVSILLALGLGALAPAPAGAATVLMMGRGGHVHRAQDRFLSARALTPAPAVSSSPRNPRLARAARTHPAAKTVRSELARLYHAGQISAPQYRAYSSSFTAALRTVKRLHGTAAAELEAVVGNLHAIAATGLLSASRLPALFLTLDRNRQWWAAGVIPGSGERVEFAGSQLVWEYYPGQGLELQVLGTFGRADGMYTAGPADYQTLGQLLDEMIPLAVRRAGGIAWEYYFNFDGGAPPWVSAMAQGTALEALTRGYKALERQAPSSGGATPSGSVPSAPVHPPYLQIAEQALALFTAAPPAGVRVPTALGARYLQYSFAPGTDIINAFLQSLIGLYDYAKESGSSEARSLFAAGNAEALAEVPQFDTGAWSLYQPGLEDDLSYHELVTGFLAQLCSRTGAAPYCTAAEHFQADMKTPPALELLSTRAIARRAAAIRFHLSKYSHVGIVLLRGSRTVFATSAEFSYGVGSFAIPPLRAGTYTVHLAATDLPGNFSRIVGTLLVSRRGR